MRWLVLGIGICMAGGCALLADLHDRDPMETEAGTSEPPSEAGAPDGSASVDGSTTNDAATTDGAVLADALVDGALPDALVDGGAEGSTKADAATDTGVGVDAHTAGVACGSTFCDAATGCCIDAGVCDSVTACFNAHANCDGPEDCPGEHCCSTGPGSLCNAGGCGAYLCHVDEDCVALGAPPKCCDSTSNPYRVCQSSCP